MIKEEQARIKNLLCDTIATLCQKGLRFKTQFAIEALIGITVDEEDILLVSINKTVNAADSGLTISAGQLDCGEPRTANPFQDDQMQCNKLMPKGRKESNRKAGPALCAKKTVSCDPSSNSTGQIFQPSESSITRTDGTGGGPGDLGIKKELGREPFFLNPRPEDIQGQVSFAVGDPVVPVYADSPAFAGWLQVGNTQPQSLHSQDGQGQSQSVSRPVRSYTVGY